MLKGLLLVVVILATLLHLSDGRRFVKSIPRKAWPVQSSELRTVITVITA